MSQEAAVPKGPAPRAEGITARKPMKYLDTLLLRWGAYEGKE